MHGVLVGFKAVQDALVACRARMLGQDRPSAELNQNDDVQQRRVQERHGNNALY